MLKQLRKKFILITMALVLLMLTVIFSLVISFTRADMDMQNQATMQRLSQILTKPVGVESLPQDIRIPWFALRVSGGMISAVGYTGYDLNDEVFLNRMLEAVLKQNTEEGILREYQLMYRATGNRQGTTIVFLDISGYRASLRALVESCIGIGIVSLGIFLVLSIFLARWAVKPVQTAWDRQKQFISDVSHELKTPLTVIMSNAELLRESPQLPEGADRYAQNITAMSYQMKDLVEGLLELTRVDNGQVKKDFSRLEMSEVLAQSLLEFEPVLYEKGLYLEADIQPDIFLSGNSRYLKQVVDILLDNAGKYSEPGVVDVKLVKQGRTCILTVANPGLPIPEAEQLKIFDRFYRADQARARTGSYGLGLAIAKAVVEEHGGKIWVAANATGNCFCIQLPCE